MRNQQQNQPQLQTRRPTGQVSWPIILLSGVEGSGKTWAAAEATGMDYIDRAFFLEVGEASADEYGAVPGADYEVIEHDGSFQMMLNSVRAAGEIPAAEGKANMLIIDSITEVWDLLTDMAQHQANRRKNGRTGPDGEKQITMDLWNWAKGSMSKFIVALRRFPGPVVITARLENVAEVEGGKPTGRHTWKIRAEKNLPYQVQAVLQAREPRRWTLTKIMSTQFPLEPGGEMALPNFTVGKLLERMGVAPGAGVSNYVETDASARAEGDDADQAQMAQQQGQGGQQRPQPPRNQHPQAPQQAPQQAQRSAPKRPPAADDWAARLEKLEQAGEVDKVAANMNWARDRGHGELFEMARGVHERMLAAQEPAQSTGGAEGSAQSSGSSPSPQEAQETAQQVLDAEVVEDDRHVA